MAISSISCQLLTENVEGIRERGRTWDRARDARKHLSVEYAMWNGQDDLVTQIKSNRH